MNDMDKGLPELLSMLRTTEQNVKSKGKSILMVSNGKKLKKGPPSRLVKGKARKFPNLNLLFLL